MKKIYIILLIVINLFCIDLTLSQNINTEILYNFTYVNSEINYSNFNPNNNNKPYTSVGALKNNSVIYSYFKNLNNNGEITFNSIQDNNFFFELIDNLTGQSISNTQKAEVVCEIYNTINYIIAGTIKNQNDLSIYLTEFNSTVGSFSKTNLLICNTTNILKYQLTKIKKINNDTIVLIGYLNETNLQLDRKIFVALFDNNLNLLSFNFYIFNNNLVSNPSLEFLLPKDFIYNETDNELIIVGNIDRINFISSNFDHRYGFFAKLNLSNLAITDLKIFTRPVPFFGLPTIHEGTSTTKVRKKIGGYYITGSVEYLIGVACPYIAELDNNGSVLDWNVYYDPSLISPYIEEGIDFRMNLTSTNDFYIATAIYDGNHPYNSKQIDLRVIQTDQNFNFINKFYKSSFYDKYPKAISLKNFPNITILGGTNDINNSGQGLYLNFRFLQHCDFNDYLIDSVLIDLQSTSILTNNIIPNIVTYDEYKNIDIITHITDYSVLCDRVNSFHKNQFNNLEEIKINKNLNNFYDKNNLYSINNLLGRLIYINIKFNEIDYIISSLESGFYIISNDKGEFI
ncbi:MAG: hypothetical protein ACK4K9_00405 [Bacteroidia bacterium]